jgi:hypothetical protein
MEELNLNENIKIKNENSIYTIEFKTSSYSIIRSLIKTRIIQGGSTDESLKKIRFKAESVKTLSKYQAEKKLSNGKKCLLVSDVAKMIRSLVVQLNYLIEKESSTILGYNPSEVIVINDEKFAYLGSELVANIDVEDNGMAMISCPFSPNNFFVSPELLRVTELPSFINYKTAYFSLGLLIIYALLGDDDFYKEFLKQNNSEKILDVLSNHPIKHTRIYWLLSRCLVEEPKNRSIILI